MAYELEKRKVRYILCTNRKDPLMNTSSLSYGHFRVPPKEDLEEVIKMSVEKYGENMERARFVYENAGQVISLLDELKVDYEPRSFGVIPTGKRRGGNLVLRALQMSIASCVTEVELIGFDSGGGEFKTFFGRNGGTFALNSGYLVLATGGFSGKFDYHDNVRYPSYNVQDMVMKNGGTIVNNDCLFVHPFGYNHGRHILVGIEVKEGEFVDECGNLVFDPETRNLVKDNNYHEIFDKVLAKISRYESQPKVYFYNSKRRVEIHPTLHYTGGGIKTDCFGETDGIPGLFAVGECRADGSKNGGRLPGYAFTSAVVDAKNLFNNVI